MRAATWRGFGALALCLTLAASARALDHAGFDELLSQHVQQGRVDYLGLKGKRSALDKYLRELSAVNPAALSRKDRLAFWINSYNAVVLAQVLDAYPIKSVKDVKGFFDKQTRAIGGEMLTLNQIEERGRALGDWRIHFAVVCASGGCPLLRDEAYQPDWLDAQLAEQTRAYLADPTHGLRVDAKNKTLWVSKIFQWYAKDFVPKGAVSVDTLLPVIEAYLDPKVAAAVKQQPLRLKFLEYDWTLNSRN